MTTDTSERGPERLDLHSAGRRARPPHRDSDEGAGGAQQTIVREQDECSIIELSGIETEDQENLITETALRGYWNYYHNVMGFS